MDEGDSSNSLGKLDAVALFPLANVVLFPRAVLPLHIFEERYKTMTADVLQSDRQIAMALLRPGWEKSYYGRPAIEPIVCVGTILSHERLEDGKYNFLLQGHTRARIVQEIEQTARPYRIAQLEPLAIKPASEEELQNQRNRLAWLFTESPLALAGGLCAQFCKLLSGDWPTPDIADLVAFSYFENVALKQFLLQETDARIRVDRTVAELEALAEKLAQSPQVQTSKPTSSMSKLHPPSLN